MEVKKKMVTSDIKQLGALALGLLVLMIILAITFIVGAQFEKSICEDIDGNSGYRSGACYSNSTFELLQESQAFNVTGDVITAIALVVSFLTIIVLILIAKILVTIARGLSTE